MWALGPYLYVTDDATFEAYLAAHDLDIADYMDPAHPKVVAIDNLQHRPTAEGGFENYHIFADTGEKEIPLYYMVETEAEGWVRSDTPVSVTIGSVQDSLAWGANDHLGYGLCMLLPESMVSAVFGDMDIFQESSRYATQFMAFAADNPDAICDEMASALNAQGLSSSPLFNVSSSQETTRNVVLIINVFSYGFIILIALISVANVFNTISTGIHLRRREFAMLKSVGMTNRGFNGMMCYKCLLYGFKALLYGCPSPCSLPTPSISASPAAGKCPSSRPGRRSSSLCAVSSPWCLSP